MHRKSDSLESLFSFPCFLFLIGYFYAGNRLYELLKRRERGVFDHMYAYLTISRCCDRLAFMKVLASKIFTVIGLLVGLVSGIVAAPVSAATMPLVTGLSATDTTSNSVSLRFNVNTNGVWTKYYVKYGENGNLTYQTSPVSIGDSSGVKFATVSGLSAGKNYTFVATVTDGTNYNNSNNISVTTGSGSTETNPGDQNPATSADNVPQAYSLKGVSATASSVVLNFRVDTKGTYTRYYIKYGENGSLTNQGSITSIGTNSGYYNATVEGLSAGKSYTFVAVVTDGTNYNNSNNIAYSTTGGGNNNDDTVPSATTRSASNVSANSATLNGYIDTKGKTVYYKFYYSPSNGSEIATSERTIYGSQNVSYDLSGLSNGTTYSYRLSVRNDLSQTNNGGQLSFTTTNGNNNNSAPTVSLRTVSNLGNTSATINFDIDPQGSSTSYRIDYGTSYSYGQTLGSYSIGSAYGSISNQITLSGLSAGSTYYYRVVAVNNGGTTERTGNFITNNYGTGLINNITFSSPSVTNRGNNSASIEGRIYANGNYIESAWFEYDYSGNSFSRTTGYKYLNSSSDRYETFYIDSLSPNASYVGRIAVRSNGQTFYSNSISFSTTGGGNQYSSAPEVETKEPSSVLYNFALLKGTVNTKASATAVWFEYGTSESNLYAKTSESNVGWENTYKDFYQISGSLKASTTYYYRAMARNAYGTDSGEVRSFRTLAWSDPKPPVIIEEPIVKTDSIGVILDRFVSTDKVDANEEFNYSLTYRNTTKGILKDATLKIVLPDELEFVNSSIRPDSSSAGLVVYRLGNVPANSQSAISITLRVKDDVKKGSVIPLNATLEWTDSSKNFQSTGAFTSVSVDKGATDSNGFFGSLSAFAGGFGWWIILLLLILIFISMIYMIASRNKKHHQA